MRLFLLLGLFLVVWGGPPPRTYQRWKLEPGSRKPKAQERFRGSLSQASQVPVSARSAHLALPGPKRSGAMWGLARRRLFVSTVSLQWPLLEAMPEAWPWTMAAVAGSWMCRGLGKIP